jgi:2-hydroxy-6-oxonona-2,4-dienedioate hydrolase
MTHSEQGTAAAQPDATVISYPLGVESCTIRVIEAGAGGDVIVLLHGSGSRADRWRRNLRGLSSAGYHVYALDFPGHGFASKNLDLDYSTPGFAKVVASAMGVLGIHEPVLVGTSLGGHVAAYIAVTSQVSVRALALVGSIGVVSVERDVGTTVDRIHDVSDAGIASKLRFLVCDESLVTEQWVHEEKWFNSSPGAEAALQQTARYVAEKANSQLVGAELAGLPVPIILLWGEQDRWVPPTVGRRIRSDVLPRAPLVLLARTGHAPYYERPDAFNRALLAFLADPAGFGSSVVTV